MKRGLRHIARHQPDDDCADVAPIGTQMKPGLELMIERRRMYDKVGPLARWTRQRIDAHPELARAPLDEQLQYFAEILPPGLIGRHALSHIGFAIEPLHSAEQLRSVE